MTRKLIFDAIRAVKGRIDPDDVAIIDNALDRIGIAQDGTEFDLGPKGFALIQKWEGYSKDLGDGRVQAYPDPGSGGDPWTIGWGSTGADITKGTIWTREQAHKRFVEHVRQFSNGVTRNVAGSPTTQNQHDAMTSLAYNVGLANFAGSTLLKKHKAGDYAGAAAEFGKWTRADGRVMQGLVNRRADEARLYRSES
jgi:GH24 family phage-related lysozyme (muramidase)